MSEEHDILVIAKKLRYDLTAMQAKVSDLIRAAADLPAPVDTKCPTCGAGFHGKLSLSEHVYLSHDGPEPEHWKEAERLAATEATD